MRDAVVSLGCLAWKVYSLPQQWTAGDELLRHTLGVVIEFVEHVFPGFPADIIDPAVNKLDFLENCKVVLHCPVVGGVKAWT